MQEKQGGKYMNFIKMDKSYLGRKSIFLQKSL